MTRFFTETFKAILAAKEIEDRVFKQMPLEDELKLVEEEIKKAKTEEEYDFLKKRKEELEKESRFKPRYFELDSETHAIVENNYKKELEKAKTERRKIIKHIEEILNKAEKEVTPLLEELREINKEMVNAAYIEPVLEGKIRNKPAQVYPPFDRHLEKFPTNNIFENEILRRAEKMFKDSIDALLNPRKFMFDRDSIKRRM